MKAKPVVTNGRKVDYEPAEHSRGDPPHLQAWLGTLENERDALIMRVRHIERVLIRYGRLRDKNGRG